MYRKRYKLHEPINVSNIMNKNRQILSKPFYHIADNEGLRRAYNQLNRIYVLMVIECILLELLGLTTERT